MKSEKIIAVVAGQLLKRYRNDAGYSVWKLASLIHRSEQQLFRYERGVNKVDLDALMAALTVLNITPKDYFTQLESELLDLGVFTKNGGHETPSPIDKGIISSTAEICVHR